MSSLKEKVLKVLVIGDLGTGKTSIIRRYVHQCFTANYKATIGFDFSEKVINWDANTLVKLQLWDVAGQEKCNVMTRSYFSEAMGSFVVFDLQQPLTLVGAKEWKKSLDNTCLQVGGSPIPVILLANKCDLSATGNSLTKSQLERVCMEQKFHSFCETSAKKDIGIKEAANSLVAQILKQQSCRSDDEELEATIELKQADTSLSTQETKCCGH